jgi:hypothetical protein
MKLLLALAALVVPIWPSGAQSRVSSLAWPAVERDTRPWTRWWWMGSAVDSANLGRELRELSRAGFGGVEITAIYGVRGAEAASVPYLSPRWVDLLAHTVTEAGRLGMGVDLPQGSGWRMGGPFVPAAEVNASLRVKLDSARGTYVAEIRPSGDKVKRPAPGNEGMAIDVFSRAATANYLDAIAGRMTRLPRGAVRSYFHDSFEYTGDGSAELFATFRARRGYDLTSELPALAGRGDADRVARVKSDYRQTLDDMLLDHFVRPLTEWSHARGSLMREQAHGSPGNLLDLYAASDIPETEIFGPLGGADSDALINKFASSAAHVAGHRLASAESFTWLGEHWTATLDDVKRAADQLFLGGINHLIYHGTAYSPREAAWPGWEFYASSEFNPRNAWWRDVPAFNAYVTRVQSVLQSGRADNDVLLYFPIWDNWHDTAGTRIDFRVHNPTWLYSKPVGEAARALWKSGYGFDYVSDRLLMDKVSASGTGVHAAGGDYATVVVPRTEHMPPETLVRLLALARDGGTVIFVDRVPTDVPGLARLDERRQQLAISARELTFSAADGAGAEVRQASVGRGRVLVGAKLSQLLARAKVRRESLSDLPGVQFLRRRRAEGYDYFLTNVGTEPVRGWVPIAVSAATVAIMDPMTGRTGIARVRAGKDDRREVRLDLDPGESRLLRTFDARVVAPRWPYERPSAASTTLAGRWSVEFMEGGPVLPARFVSDTLQGWTGRGDPDADRFAGTARYSVRFDAPTDAPDFALDLGRVAESARVRLNGKELGVLFARPFRIGTGQLQRKDNLLEIDVTNLSANRIRDLDRRGVPWKIFHDINYVGIDYKPFDASAWPLRTSGLIGPVTLTPLTPEIDGTR